MFREQMLEFGEAWLESSKVSFTWYLTSVSERLFFFNYSEYILLGEPLELNFELIIGKK